MNLTGEFIIGDRTFTYEILEITDNSGEVRSGPEVEDHIRESDQVFYAAKRDDGEIFYRWLGGPFQDLDQVGEAIRDETDVYESA